MWKRLKGYDKYEISNTGFVRNVKTGRVLKFNINGAGYRRACLSKKGTQSYPFIHRLVWETFIGEIPKDKVIDHIDNNKLNNRLDNLQLLTFQNNLKKIYGRKPNHYNKITDATKMEIIDDLDRGVSARQISKKYPISYTYACKVKRDGLWRD